MASKNYKICQSNCLEITKTDKIELSLLSEGKREVIYKKGETALKQNSFASHIVYLKEGLIKIIVEGENERNIILKFVLSGQFISFAALGYDNIFSFTAIAVKTSRICIIKKKNFDEIMNIAPKIRNHIIKLCSNDYKFILKRLSVIGTKNVHGRFAETLLYLAQKEFQDVDIYMYITRKNLAEFGGMSSESTIKLLKEFKNDKLIETKGKRIIIKDIEMLERLCRIG